MDPGTTSPFFLLANAAAVAAAVAAVARIYRQPRSKSCPPGPTPLPVLGCALQIDTQQPWLTFSEWKEVYGDIVYCPIFGQDVFVVNTEKAAEDLFDKRSGNYSDRMDTSVLAKYYGLGYHTGQSRHNDTWRAHRRVVQQGLRREPVEVYRPVQLRRTHDLIKSLRESPSQYWHHFKRFSGTTILEVVYDHSVSENDEDDPVLKEISDANDLSIFLLAPGKILCLSIFPFLRYIPSWFLGGQFNSAFCRKQQETMLDLPYNEIKSKVAGGGASRCLVADALERYDDQIDKDFDKTLRDAFGSAYAAGEETTGSTLMIFILAMVLSPHVQKRAQSEIDTFIGTGRLPNFDDWAGLPYVEAVLRETLRWYTVVPQGLPHAASGEDVYRGYHIPKGSVIVPNVWAMTRNPEKYPSPSEFKPERFLDDEGNLTRDEVDFVFGFGRRVCPGRYLARASIWVAIACILAEFNIEKDKDAEGRPIEPEPEWVHGLTSAPRSFSCNIVPRSL
ncbi:PAH-inducible cytochrome P450 monooxygenase PC-PAH 6 [Coniophora puteana RWD-64-598 SS2]|uniref:PAH-inducible cytochrome P450 monooxygenase PC-PAH 6 n=1 Tax=Coniophora puteana (strain RWD-64-598) TaxID=741705 RepID=A0A5M3MZ72_CONPW|nr:PAH-inducible cytochrome P450 monooxygenase PC-PAH 6 [Coniophora puteana RWD-64-598 SS2]EIW84442.1 PAH-inducible cytochrome P450 monooxygenase PC-PAH 6 [Coniophora puteana RWD-64-598 SS2]